MQCAQHYSQFIVKTQQMLAVILTWHCYYDYFCRYELCRVFGHFSHRSEWQLVKVDYKSIFDRRCAEEDYRPWQLHSQVGETEKLSPG